METPCRTSSVRRRPPPAALPPGRPASRPTSGSPPPECPGRWPAAWRTGPRTVHAQSTRPTCRPAVQLNCATLITARQCVLFIEEQEHLATFTHLLPVWACKIAKYKLWHEALLPNNQPFWDQEGMNRLRRLQMPPAYSKGQEKQHGKEGSNVHGIAF